MQPRGPSNPSFEPEEDPSARSGHGAVRVLPREFVAEALHASGMTRETDARLPKVVLPDHLDHVTDVARLVRLGDAVVLKLDRLDEVQRERALDVVTGIACALNARVSKLDGGVDGILITPDAEAPELSEPPIASAPAALPLAERSPGAESSERAAEPPRAERTAARRTACVLCDQRAAVAEFDSPLEMILRRDGSRDWAPRVGVCRRCQRSIRHWRFAVAWCSQCERWGRRGVISPCGLVYGA